MQEQLEVWKEQAFHMWNVANDYLREVPPNQLYAAVAIALFTTLFFSYVSEFVLLFSFPFFNVMSFSFMVCVL
jgi:hypothetical protein